MLKSPVKLLGVFALNLPKRQIILRSYSVLCQNKHSDDLKLAGRLSSFYQHNFAKNVEKRFVSDIGSKSEDGVLLYKGKEGNRLRRILAIFYSSSLVVGCGAPMMFPLASQSLLATCFLSFNIFVFVFLNPLLFYQFGRRHVNELYHNPVTDKYTATIISPFVYKDKKIVFKATECQMPAVPSAFTSFYVKGNPLFINSDAMNYNAYMHMLRNRAWKTAEKIESSAYSRSEINDKKIVRIKTDEEHANTLDYENPDRQEEYEKKRGDQKR